MIMNEQKYYTPDISDPRGDGIVVNTEKGGYIYYPNGELVSASTGESFIEEFATGDIVLFNGKKHIVKVINGLDCEIQPIFEMGLIKCPLSSLTHLYFNTSRLKEVFNADEFYVPLEPNPPYSGKARKFSISTEGMGGITAFASKVQEDYSVGYESNAPITKGFIESFGFVKENSPNYIAEGFDVYVKKIGIDKRVMLIHWVKANSYKLHYNNGVIVEVLFRDFTCTTQSELRFLLTKGRIDCSK